jgi:2-polyprenyl-3-methyl-5-hydroxy-6-metoxy-1,4-benzoquinol methylase
VDIVEEGIHELQKQGFNVAYCDITSNPENFITEQFDVIICGEVIEHLGNPGSLFEAARRFLVPGGRLVVTTPNPFFLGFILRHLFNVPEDSVDHVTLLFPSGVAELADRAGLELAEYRGVYPTPISVQRKMILSMKWLVRAAMNHEAVCDTFIYECVKPATDR